MVVFVLNLIKSLQRAEAREGERELQKVTCTDTHIHTNAEKEKVTESARERERERNNASSDQGLTGIVYTAAQMLAPFQ